MNITRIVQGLGAGALLVAAGCNTLDVQNPNAPDRTRALADPSAVEAVAGGALRTWFDAFTNLQTAGVMDDQAKSYASSWNNGNLNFYSSVDNPSSPPDQWNRMTRTWQNDPASSARTSIDAFWGGSPDQSGNSRGGFYTSLGAANTALIAIRKNGLIITDSLTTKRDEAIAEFMQGASLMMLALDYDKAYIVDENTNLATLQYSNRKQVRDAAMQKLQTAATLASTPGLPDTPKEWANGISYTMPQIAQIANTMAAMTLAYYPRNNTEVAGVDWTSVANFASKGMSAGTPVDFWFVQDGYSNWVSELMNWFDGIDGGRMDTRVAHFLDPATQVDPWPLSGNPQPNSPDKRLGDGTFGNAANQSGQGTIPVDANAGTDYAWSGTAIMRPSRGQYHQSNIAQIRYDFTHVMDPSGTYGGFGPAPAINATVNDLLWAEALLRQGGAQNALAASQLIDKTRVARGGLPSSASAVANIGTDADGPCMATGVQAKDGQPCSLYAMLLYEKEVEEPGLGPIPFWEERKLPVIFGGGWPGDNSPKRIIAGLLPGTPREMPVPYKELGVKGEPLYTWGGATPNSPTP